MARMHSRKRGKSHSHKPVKKTKPTWVRYKQKEIEMIVTKLAKEGKTKSQIGLILRDIYGVPDIRHVLDKKLGAFLIEKELEHKIPEDLMALLKKNVLLQKHILNNKQDMTSKRGIQLTMSKINRLVKFYKDRGVLEPTWKYDPKKIFVE